ncbi:DUF1850 domain-containing protein [Plastorhodobacter daqingensis]|uniref:DUF1850 domain-containing protein n=1 Tax=Plastorhodobacter daqingensis TaxID=1387281 RepID=A0ABW2UMC2_9RHOB
MFRSLAGRLLAALLVLPGAAGAGVLEVRSADRLLVRQDAADDWCLHWSHSVTGGAVADCFADRDGRMVLVRSFLHDAAAGLGHIPGRGDMRPAAGGGYWIEGINEVLPCNRLILRVGALRVGHELRIAGHVIPLSALAAGERVEISLHSDGQAASACAQ